MGATDNLKEILLDYEIRNRVCGICFENLASDNYLIYFRTNGNADWTRFEKGKSRGWIGLEIEFAHEICPKR